MIYPIKEYIQESEKQLYKVMIFKLIELKDIKYDK